MDNPLGNFEAVRTENEKRKKAQQVQYDPFRGIGSRLDRFRLQLDDSPSLYLPDSMAYTEIVRLLFREKSIEKAAGKIDQSTEELKNHLNRIRLTYDYEFWAATCCTITNKKGKKVPLILNGPQRKSLAGRERMRLGGKPVRQIELKFRQYGSTTEKNAYAFWLQNVVYDNYSSYICSLDATASTKIIGRYKTIADNYEVEPLEIRPYMGLKNTYQIETNGARISVGTAKRPNAPSGDTTQIVLISEAGKMKDTTDQGANKLITNMMSMTPNRPDTFVMIESTAEISGTWFRNEVFRAKDGKGNFCLTFISWLDDPDLPDEAPPIENYKHFVSNVSEYDKKLWKMGATLEQIKWYRHKQGDYQSDWAMKQENPSTISEAFQSTGHRFIPAAYVDNMRDTIREPAHIGDLVADAAKGASALENIRFEPNPNGNLLIWNRPGQPEGEHPVSGRYGAFADIGGTTKEADWSVVSIMDSYWMLEGGLPERACTLRGHWDQDLFAWKAVQLAKWYSNALLAIEINSLNRNKDNSLTILDEIKEHYYYLFARSSNQEQEKLNEGTPRKYGFHTNKRTKRLIYNRIVAGCRDKEYIERDQRVINEMDYFEQKEDGSLGAAEGQHDDLLDTTAGAVWMALEYMDPPFYEKPHETIDRSNYNEAMI